MKNYDIIVIGAGCGGLTAASFAAKEGKKVLLLERHNTPGGFMTSFVRGRFEFETSLHELCGFGNDAGLGELRSILDELSISNKLNWTSVPEAYRLITTSKNGQKIDVTMPFGVDEYINAMEQIVPGSKEPMKKLMELAENISNAVGFISESDSSYNYKFLRSVMKEYGNFIRTAPYSVNEVLDAIKLPQKAKEIFTAYWCYLGVDCDRLSFTHYISMVYSYLKFGAVVPKLRGHDLAMALQSVIEDNNGDVRFNSHVSRILFENGHASGVLLKNGEKIMCRHIVCNCSPTTVYSKMMKKADVPVSAVKRTNARSFGVRGAGLYLGLNRSPEELGIKDYSLFLYDTADSAEQFSLMKTIDTNNMSAVVCLNKADPECSPIGTTILCFTTLFTDNCWANVEPDDYFNEKDYLAARLISNYEKATGIIIHNSIEELEVATPVTFARYTNTPQGTIYGYLGSEWDGIVARITTEKTDCDTKGLRFCGGWDAQLSGVSSSVASGRNAAYATLGDIKDDSTEAAK